MKKISQKGFTLIELLVVIAIIGILSSVVLASLNTARSKGKDASAQGSLSSVRNQAEIYYGTSNNYGAATTVTVAIDPTTVPTVTAGPGFCSADVQTLSLLRAVSANAASVANCAVGVSGQSWIAYVKLGTQTAPANYCVDSTGFAGTRTAAPFATAISAAVSCN